MKSIFILLDNMITIYLWIIIINAILSWLVAFNVLNTQNSIDNNNPKINSNNTI